MYGGYEDDVFPYECREDIEDNVYTDECREDIEDVYWYECVKNGNLRQPLRMMKIK